MKPTKISGRFAGFHIDDEVRREKEESAEKAKPAEGKKAETPQQNRIVTYKDIEFEQLAYREYGESNKRLLYFDTSLERLKSAGFERHARPQEMFGLLIDGLEGKLNGNLAEVEKDTLTSLDEWTSMAFERKGDILIAHIDPEGLVWDGNNYVKQNFKNNGQQEFNVKGKACDTWRPLNEFNEDLVRFLYTRPFKDLPEKMQICASIGLPPEGFAWPVGHYQYNVTGGKDFEKRASRGVR